MYGFHVTVTTRPTALRSVIYLAEWPQNIHLFIHTPATGWLLTPRLATSVPLASPPDDQKLQEGLHQSQGLNVWLV